ncbi:Alpha/Beta hydrolase protein [Amanita rubescens]|nr:Alpha/Beta hydrolase protein [Amanita rubescens]
MPFVTVDGPDGPFDFCYVISTPTKVSAESVDPDIPTILFIHSNFTWKESFQLQFENPTLRQFNLVTFDHRACGESVGHITQDPYRPSHITDDLCKIFETLKLPPCHVFGIEVGSHVALDFAARHPEWVLSLMICSPMPPVESEEVMTGRMQIIQYFERHVQGKLAEDQPSEEGIGEDAVLGANQLAYNLSHTPLVHALARLGWDAVKQNMAGSLEGLTTAIKLNVGLFKDHIPLTKNHLSKIQCPITIIHCIDDIGYCIEIANDLRTTLIEAGCRVKPVVEVPGPRYACVTHPDKIDSVIFDNVVSNSPGGAQRFKVKSPSERLETPFLERLGRHGYHGADDPETESMGYPCA